MNNKVTLKERLQYWTDNRLMEGTKSMIWALLIATVIMVLICGIVLAIATDSSIGYGIWKSLMHIFDGGTMGGDDEEFGFMAPMFVITVFGIIVFSTLVGVINNGLESKLASLEAGNFKIIENNHILILGFDSEIYSIISELIIANEEGFDGSDGGTIVILDSFLTPKEMKDMVASKFHDTKNTKIIYRKGTVYSVDALEKCSANTAKNIIVNLDNDAVVLKCILAADIVLKNYNNTTTKIITTMKNEDNKAAALHASGKRTLILDIEDIIAKIIAQSCRYHGISEVFEEFFSFDGSEFYIEPVEDFLIGKRVKDVALFYENAIVAGKFSSSGVATLIPIMEENAIVEKGDRLIFLAEDDSLIKAKTEAIACEDIKGLDVVEDFMQDSVSILILRYSSKLEKVLEEGYKISDQTNVTVAIEEINYNKPEIQASMQRIKKHFADKKLEFKTVKTFGRQSISSLIEETNPDSVLVLSNKEGVIETLEDEELMHKQCEREDAKNMFILLLLRSIAENKNYNYNITSELQYSDNQKLAKDTGVNDFVVGSNFANMIRTQIADDVERFDLISDIVSSVGTEIYFYHANKLFDTSASYSVVSLRKLFLKRNEVFVGYCKCDENEHQKIIINPSNGNITFGDNDILIALVKGK